jgi:tRNA threonylcarbamoyladenosine biosynthesis protein TsaB
VRILAIETSTEVCSIALADGADVAQQRESVGARVAERALSMIAQLLADRQIALSQIDAFAYGRGPGSFTGLRVGCALVQGLAFAGDRPVVPVGSLRALAHGARRRMLREQRSDSDGPSRVLVAIDARMGQIYWAVYQGAHAGQQLAAPALASPEQMVAVVAQWQPQVIAGEALRAFAHAWPGSVNETRLPDVACEASMIAELARIDLDAGQSIAARHAALEYVRDEVALTTEQRARSRADRRESGQEGRAS